MISTKKYLEAKIFLTELAQHPFDGEYYCINLPKKDLSDDSSYEHKFGTQIENLVYLGLLKSKSEEIFTEVKQGNKFIYQSHVKLSCLGMAIKNNRLGIGTLWIYQAMGLIKPLLFVVLIGCVAGIVSTWLKNAS